MVTRSDKLGTYKLPGFGKHISPNNITISCSKDGYKQTRTLRRTAPGPYRTRCHDCGQVFTTRAAESRHLDEVKHCRYAIDI